MQWTIAVANDRALAADPESIHAVLRGCRRSYRYAAANVDEWIVFGARQFGIPAEIMAAAIARELPNLHLDCEINLDGYRRPCGCSMGWARCDRPLDVADIVDLRFQQSHAPD